MPCWGCFWKSLAASLTATYPASNQRVRYRRFLNHYSWSTRAVIRSTRQAVLQQIAQHRPRKDLPLRVLIDLTSLEKCGKFFHLGTIADDSEAPDPWVRILNGKRGLHIVVLYLVVGQWRVPWSFRVWRRKGYPSPSQLACKLLATVPHALSQDVPVIVGRRYGIWHHRVSSGSQEALLACCGRDALHSKNAGWSQPQSALPQR